MRSKPESTVGEQFQLSADDGGLTMIIDLSFFSELPSISHLKLSIDSSSNDDVLRQLELCRCLDARICSTHWGKITLLMKGDFGEKAILRKAIGGECLELGDFEAVDFWIEGDFCPSV